MSNEQSPSAAIAHFFLSSLLLRPQSAVLPICIPGSFFPPHSPLPQGFFAYTLRRSIRLRAERKARKIFFPIAKLQTLPNCKKWEWEIYCSSTVQNFTLDFISKTFSKVFLSSHLNEIFYFRIQYHFLFLHTKKPVHFRYRHTLLKHICTEAATVYEQSGAHTLDRAHESLFLCLESAARLRVRGGGGNHCGGGGGRREEEGKSFPLLAA